MLAPGGAGETGRGPDGAAHHGDRGEQRPERHQGRRAHQTRQRRLAAPQPGGREQPDGHMGGEQQPRHGRTRLRQQGRRAVARTGHPGERGAHRADARDPRPGRADLAAPAEHVEADRAQRARDGPAGRPVTEVLAGGEERVGRQLQRDEQPRDGAEAALPPGQRVRHAEDDRREERDGGQRQRDPGEQHMGRRGQGDDERGEKRRAHHPELRT
ncbi:hypothetical protein SCYAM73S_01555 [Streptomyces cyaneofuscatus]